MIIELPDTQVSIKYINIHFLFILNYAGKHLASKVRIRGGGGWSLGDPEAQASAAWAASLS